jgi:hypothetical protein
MLQFVESAQHIYFRQPADFHVKWEFYDQLPNLWGKKNGGGGGGPETWASEMKNKKIF